MRARLIAFLLLFSFAGFAQEAVPAKPTDTAPAKIAEATPANLATPEPAKPTEVVTAKPAEAVIATATASSSVIPKGARFYVAPIQGGYDIYLTAAIQKKEVPIIVVTDRTKADFEIAGATESEKAGWAKMFFLGSDATAEQASIKVANLKTGEIVFGYNVNKRNSVRGKQSSSEACAKHLKEKIDGGK